MLLAEQKKEKTTYSAQGEISRPDMPAGLGKANCAGYQCTERNQCRRYRVRIEESWHKTTGAWASFDLERLQQGGECPAFKRWIPERKGRGAAD